VEAVGALVLWVEWGPTLGWQGAVWHAVFHSVSAFCNAGFSTFSDSLMSFADSPLTLGTVSFLIVFGGIGFIVLEELRLRLWRAVRGGPRVRLSLHTRLVLATSGALLVLPTPLFAWFEWTTTLGELSAWDRWANAAFASVTARTAGFNSIDYAAADSSSNLLTIILMFIGGGPGGTAGGVKVTTFALILILAWSRFRGRLVAQVWGCSVSDELTGRATGLVVAAVIVVIVGLFALTRTATAGQTPQLFLMYAFETVSAFNTVGLSMGATGLLDGLGAWTVIGLMFVGRVGTLTFAAALAWSGRRRDRFRYAYHHVIVG
jgi:trk system potassium uptake protein TrkH